MRISAAAIRGKTDKTKNKKQKTALFRANKHQEKSILSNCRTTYHKPTYRKSKCPQIQKKSLSLHDRSQIACPQIQKKV